MSRRTDIPACYSDWFFERLRAGFVLVRNPMNPRRVARVNLTPDVVDGIVFWTKNPLPMLPRLDELAAYPYYFQVTITPYGTDLEPGVPDKDTVILPAFQRLSDTIGPERMVWRYDPILLNPTYTAAYHADVFARMCERLQGYTRRCVISFVDDYRSTARNADALRLAPIGGEDMRGLAATLSRIAREHGMDIVACAEETDLTAQGVARSSCIDAALLSDIAGVPLKIGRDRNQRPACGCAASIDIGMYNTCRNGCKYCYANYDEKKIPKNTNAHDVHSPLLVGHVSDADTVYDRVVESKAVRQTRLDL